MKQKKFSIVGNCNLARYIHQKENMTGRVHVLNLNAGEYYNEEEFKSGINHTT